MPRPYDPHAKSHDPAYITARNREVRQRHHAQVAIRVSDETRERWHQAAEREGLSLKAWIERALNQAASNRGILELGETPDPPRRKE